ncbi:MAG: DUF4097 family beta strand repeat protein [Clostridia bacterium]|nr:DUF4097 family beta strand repeat protein [Clostridia bacterium]
MNIETANRLIELRKRKGLSQEELANALGISRQAVSKWERAEAGPDVDNAILLSRLYNISLDELFGNKPEYERALERMELAEDEPGEELSADDPSEEPDEAASFAESVGENAFTGVRRLVIFARADVELTASGGDKCFVTISGPKAECDKCRIFCEDDALHIETEEKQRHIFFGGRKGLHISVDLPYGMKSVEGTLIGGDIVINGVESELMNIKTGGGDIEAKELFAGEIGLSTGGGDIDIRNVNAKRAELTTGGGEIEGAGIDCAGAFSATTGGGDIEVSGRAKCVAAKSGGGDITLGFCAEGFEVKSGGGDIKITAEGTKSISAKTGGGDIRTVLRGSQGISADLASMGGASRLSVAGTRIASGRKIEMTVGDGSTRLEMRSGGGDITVEAE